MTRTRSSTLLFYLFLLFNLKIYHVLGTEEENNKTNISTITNIILNQNPDERSHNEIVEKIKEAQDQLNQKNVEPLKLKEETITQQNKTLLQKFNPKDITFHIIFQFLNPFDICQVTKVCKSFYQCYVASAADEKEILKEKRKNLNENEEKTYKHNDFCHYSFFDKKVFKFPEKKYTEYVINEKTYTKNSGILPKSIFQMFFTQHSYRRLIPLKRGKIYLIIDDQVRYILYKNKCLSVRFDNKEKFSQADNRIFRLRLDPPLQQFLNQHLNPTVGIMYENGGEEHMRLAEYGTPALDDFSICKCPHEIKTILLDDYVTYLKLSEREGKLMLLGIFKNEEDYIIRETLQKFNIFQFKGHNLSNLKDIIFVTPLGEKKFGDL